MRLCIRRFLFLVVVTTVQLTTERLQDDLRLVEDAGRGAIDVTVGSALDIFGGALAYEDVVKWHVEHSGATSA